MRTILPFTITDAELIEDVEHHRLMPRGSVPVSATRSFVGEGLTVWYDVPDTAQPNINMNVYASSTNRPAQPYWAYIGTVVTGALTRHVWAA